MLTHFLFLLPSQFCFAKQVPAEEKDGISFPRRLLSLTSHQEPLLDVPMFLARRCHPSAAHSWWLPRPAGGDLTDSCPSWTPVCPHLPFQGVFASVLRNKWEPEVLCHRSRWFLPAMSPAERVPQPCVPRACASSHSGICWATGFMLSVLCFKVLRKMQRRHSSNTDNVPPER